MNDQYSHILLQHILEFTNSHEQRSRWLPAVVNRLLLMCRQSAVILFHQFDQKRTERIGVSGPAINYGAGDVRIGAVSLVGLIRDYIFKKDIISVLTLQRTATPFTVRIRNELKADQATDVSLKYTAQDILIIKYTSKGVVKIRKIAINKKGKKYLNRQLSSLLQLKADFAESHKAFALPAYKNHFETPVQMVLEQTYIPGDIVNIKKSNEADLFDYFRKAVECALALSVGKTPRGARWSAYGDIDRIAPHYSGQEAFSNVVDYMIGWMQRSDQRDVYIHGDFQFGNLVFENGEMKGIIDWDRSGGGGAKLHDVLHLTISTVSGKNGVFYGQTIVNILSSKKSDRLLRRFLDYLIRVTGVSFEDLQHMAILLWLFYLQISIVEEQKPAEKWIQCMVADTLPVVHSYCQSRKKESQ